MQSVRDVVRAAFRGVSHITFGFAGSLASLKLMVAFIAVLAASVAMSASAADSDSKSGSLPPLDSIDQRALACTPCHGKEGRATNDAYYPRIAGKPAGYLFNQLLNFREGRRHYPMMAYFTDRQQESYLREIAAYFASQILPYPAPQPPRVTPAVLERGRALVTQGDPAQEIPACSACHGVRLMGVTPAVPGLLGLSRDYLAAQLGAWMNGTRRAHAPDCMAEIVKDMRPEDLAAATAWLAAQSVPADAHPDAQFEQPPPRSCGSIRETEPNP
jgi:cytochrome c553